MTTPPIRNRYEAPKSPETEFEPGSRGRVLRNLLGIKSVREMGIQEFILFKKVQEEYLIGRITQDTSLTAKLICEMHKDWLGSVYPWAGQYRTVNVSKAGFTWPPAFKVNDLMIEFEKKILAKHTPCKTTEVVQLSKSLAIVHGDLLLIHPFREGNGRIARWVADLMCLQAGFPPPAYRFTGVGSTIRRDQYLQAVKQSYLMRYDALEGFFAESISFAIREGLRR